MHSQQRLYAKVIFDAQFAELHGNAFQEYFQKLMQYRYPSFLPVRPHGSLGDKGSDGLCAYRDKLFACYGPQSPSDEATRKKFRGDVSSAISNRSDEFDTFVFVHNDRVGMHPQIASEIMHAHGSHPEISFEQMGRVAIWREFMRLELDEAEDMLGQEIRVEQLVYGISLANIQPLLTHLGRIRGEHESADPHVIPMNKLEFNNLSQDTQDLLVQGLRFVKQVADYYDGLYDVLARDETAAAFREKYEELRREGLGPEEIFHELFIYVVGNKVPNPTVIISVCTILSYFFQTCDIFEEPPSSYSYTNGRRA